MRLMYWSFLFVCFLTRDFLYLISTLAAVTVVNHAFIVASLQCSLNDKQEASGTFQYRNGWLKKKTWLVRWML